MKLVLTTKLLPLFQPFPLSYRINVTQFLYQQHKKLAEGSAYEEVSTSTPYSENDISNSIKNGILFLEDPINHVRARIYSH